MPRILKCEIFIGINELNKLLNVLFYIFYIYLYLFITEIFIL